MPEYLITTISWLLAVLIFPGALFGLALALCGEWLAEWATPLAAPRLYRAPTGQHRLLQPLYDLLKLAGRREPDVVPGEDVSVAPHPASGSLLAPLGAIAAILALTLMPFPGSPLTGQIGPVGDLFTVLVLLAVQPLCRVVLSLRGGGLASLAGQQMLGRFILGLVPAVLAFAALAESAGTPASRTLQIAGLGAAPETGWQFVVRVFGGAALLLALPWWTGKKGSGIGDRGSESWTAAVATGELFHTAALSALWALVVLPQPGDTFWALLVAIPGALLAYVVIRVVPTRWWAARRDEEAARLLWATSLPAAVLALAIAVVGSR